jgi:RHS repeat-associated protein
MLDAFSGVANLTSSSGATEWTYHYDAWGTDTGTTKNDPNAPTNIMRFDSQFLDAATGLYYLRARLYDQSIGRLLQLDPVAALPTEPYSSSYAYTLDRPTVLSYPSGMWPGQGIWRKIAHPFVEFGKDWTSGANELYQDWKAGPTTPKVVGGAMIVASLAVIGGAALLGAEAGVAECPLELTAEESWGNLDSLAEHFGDHGADFGATSSEDYAAQASRFLQESQAEGFPTKIDAEGVIRVYDPETNTFGAYNPDGTTRTFFKPTTRIRYWIRQP